MSHYFCLNDFGPSWQTNKESSVNVKLSIENMLTPAHHEGQKGIHKCRTKMSYIYKQNMHLKVDYMVCFNTILQIHVVPIM